MTVLRRASLLAARPKNDYYDHNDLMGAVGYEHACMDRGRGEGEIQ